MNDAHNEKHGLGTVFAERVELMGTEAAFGFGSRIIAVEEADGAQFLTMEYVEVDKLDQLIPAGGMPITRVFVIAMKLVDALGAAHRNGAGRLGRTPGGPQLRHAGQRARRSRGARRRGGELRGQRGIEPTSGGSADRSSPEGDERPERDRPGDTR